jgi:hypothetical protein
MRGAISKSGDNSSLAEEVGERKQENRAKPNRTEAAKRKPSQEPPGD